MTQAQQKYNLFFLIMSDLSRHFFLIILFFLVLASAFSVTVSAHQNRQLNIAQEQLIQEKDALDVQWRHLIIEQSALTEHNLIERNVYEKLNMRRPNTDDEVLLRLK